MEVILTHDVEKLGLKGDVVDVKRGYARNFLLPRRLAEVATAGRVAELRRIEAGRARHEARTAEHAEEIASTLTKTVLRFEVKAGPTGALFGSVTPTDVAEELWRTRKIRIDRRKIELDVIKRIGRYSIPVHVFEGVTAEVKTLVVPEGGELPPEEELAALEAAERAEAEEAEAAREEALRETEAAVAAEDELRTAEAEATRRRGARGDRAGRCTRGGVRRGRGGGPSRLSTAPPTSSTGASPPVDSRTKTPLRAPVSSRRLHRSLWTACPALGIHCEHVFRSPWSAGCSAVNRSILDASRRDGFDPAR